MVSGAGLIVSSLAYMIIDGNKQHALACVERLYMESKETQQANAALISAAPDLLAALEGCHDALVEAGKTFALQNPYAARPNLFELHAAAAHAAIAKAKAG